MEATIKGALATPAKHEMYASISRGNTLLNDILTLTTEETPTETKKQRKGSIADQETDDRDVLLSQTRIADYGGLLFES